MTEKFLSQEEVDSLLKGVTGETDSPDQAVDLAGIRPYNLATQERIVRGRMPTLELINERFARLLRIGLYNFLRRSSEVAAGTVRIIKYSEFLRHLMVPTNLNVVQIKPLRGSALIVMDPDLVFLFVDNFFGGDGRFQTRIEGRDFTQTEQRTIQRILSIIFETYEKSWESVHPIEFVFVRSEMNTQFANIATPNEVVVAITFDIELGSVGGQMHMCIPYSMIEPIRDILSSSLQGESLSVDQRWIHLMKQQLQLAEVETVADLCTTQSSLREVLNMQVGDIIPVNLPETIELKVDGVPIMECSYGQLNGQYALRVERLISASGSISQGENNG
jgi:flagellar motor switch protein FliM